MNKNSKITVPNFFPVKQIMPEPQKMSCKDLLKYQSLDEIKIAQSFRNYKAALPYMAGLGLGMLIVKFYTDKQVKAQVFGENNNGGSMLDMYTKNSPLDMAYNREFQRMRYLIEDPIRNDPFTNTSAQLLADLGATPKNYGLNREAVQKKAPHYKYY